MPVPPVATVLGLVNRVRLGCDYYVPLDSCDYSVDTAVIGRFIDVTVDLVRVEGRHEGCLAMRHDDLPIPHV